jgi:hypothetical protein
MNDDWDDEIAFAAGSVVQYSDESAAAAAAAATATSEHAGSDASAEARELIRATAGMFGAPIDDAEGVGKPRTRLARGTGVDALLEAVALAEAEALADETSDDDCIDVLPEVSRKVTKPRVRTKRNRPRSKTIALKRLTRAELARGALESPPVDDVARPVTRAECREAQRPCPWVACKHHLYLDINPKTGSIKINFPDLEPWELEHTCALDVAENGALTLEEIGLITNLTRERVRQVEVRGLLTLKSRSNSLR